MDNDVERRQLLANDREGPSPSSSAPAAAAESWLERFYTPKMCVIMFTLVNLFTYFDRGAISATLTHIRSDSTIAGDDGVISETKGGMIVSVFMIGYMFACPIFAALGKYVSVRILVATGLAIWCVACVVTGLAQGYTMLILTRMMVGVGEASFSGYFVTILDNIAPKSQRTAWIGMFYCMIPTGTALGMAAAGAISSLEFKGIPGWRLVFFLEIIVSLPFVVFCCLFPSKYAPTTVGTTDNAAANTAHNSGVDADAESLRTDRSPDSSLLNSRVDSGIQQQHGDQQQVYSNSSNANANPTAGDTTTPSGDVVDPNAIDKSYADPLTAMKHLICNVDYILICVGYGMYVFVTGALAVWAISMLTNGPWHMSDVAASSTIGGIVAITGLAGSVFGGVFVDKMGGSQGSKGVLKCLMFGSVMMAASLPFGISAMFIYNVPAFVVLFVCGVFCVFTITAPINASILSVVRRDVRTYGMSFSTMFIHLIGDFPSPTVAGAIADSFDEGCGDLSDEWLCRNATATNCWWVEPKKNSNGHCTNEYETRNAMVIVFAFIAFAIPVWAVACVRARRRIAEEESGEAAAIISGEGQTGKASGIQQS